MISVQRALYVSCETHMVVSRVKRSLWEWGYPPVVLPTCADTECLSEICLVNNKKMPQRTESGWESYRLCNLVISQVIKLSPLRTLKATSDQVDHISIVSSQRPPWTRARTNTIGRYPSKDITQHIISWSLTK